MNIRVKMVGILRDKTPPSECINVAEKATIGDVLSTLDVLPQDVHICTVNGELIRDQAHSLEDGDELTILPPFVGG